ncbi:hypothetical protein CIW83_09405 [Tissierella sp. P1]|uniref:hypothetical protein n=1 Tax=Tissierella sp. P1 TaxID=1280483 RepID=UPI000BA10B66|nr:hypothetical protein [Tissierella sp. P1]OZV12305.1 hypothetical protein CIW83_09405 [Tissierella sp. P1]
MTNITKQNKHEIYMRAYFKSLLAVLEEENKVSEHIKKTIFYGVKAIITRPRLEYITREEVTHRFQTINIIQDCIGLLTPKEFMNIFPIAKEYDGYKWEMKDYFYTINYINTLDSNVPIGTGDKILDFLWKYYNRDILMFCVESMICASDLRKLEGYSSLLEEWATENGIKTYVMHTDSKGNQFLLDKETGTTTKVSKPRPKHLKIVK